MFTNQIIGGLFKFDLITPFYEMMFLSAWAEISVQIEIAAVNPFTLFRVQGGYN